MGSEARDPAARQARRASTATRSLSVECAESPSLALPVRLQVAGNGTAEETAARVTQRRIDEHPSAAHRALTRAGAGDSWNATSQGGTARLQASILLHDANRTVQLTLHPIADWSNATNPRCAGFGVTIPVI
jgi:hypothetical protein